MSETTEKRSAADPTKKKKLALADAYHQEEASDTNRITSDTSNTPTVDDSLITPTTTDGNKGSFTKDAAADPTDRYRIYENRKAERSGGGGDKTREEPASASVSTPGAQRIGASYSEKDVMEKIKSENSDIGVGVVQDEEEEERNQQVPNTNDTTVGGDEVPLAAEISDIHEENERLKRELEERNKKQEQAGDTNIPVAQVLPKIPSNVGSSDEENQEEGCRPTKTNIACMVLCFAVILGTVIGIVVASSNNTGDKTTTVEPEGSPQPSVPPTWTQMPSAAPSETPLWLFVAEKVFSKEIEERISNEEFLELLAQSPNGIVWRSCPNCTSSFHQNIYYKRLTDPPAEERDFNGEIPSHFLDLFLNNWYQNPNNLLNQDFELYSSYEDALTGNNKWEYCNYDQKKIGFPRDCAPNGTSIVPRQWTSFLGSDRYGAGVDHVFYVENKVPATTPPIVTDDDNDGVVYNDDDDEPYSQGPTAMPTFTAVPTAVSVPAPTNLPTTTVVPTATDNIVFDDDALMLLDDDFIILPIPQDPPSMAPVPATNMPVPTPSNVPIAPPTILPPPVGTRVPTRPILPGLPTTNDRPVAPPTELPVPAPTNLPVSSPTIAPIPPSDVVGACNDPSFVQFELVLSTDFFGSETTWDLVGSDGSTIIVSGGPYGDLQTVGVGLIVDGETFCIPVMDCYTLTIRDEFGDGIYSPGGYRVSIGDAVVAQVVGGTKFSTRVIDIATTVSNFPFAGSTTIQNCKDIPVDSRCTLEDFMNEEFLGGIGQEFSYSVTIGGKFTQKDMRTDTQSLVGTFDYIRGNTAFYSGGDYCEAIGGQRFGSVELVESSEVDSVQTFFSEPSDCVFAVEITVPTSICGTPSTLPTVNGDGTASLTPIILYPDTPTVPSPSPFAPTIIHTNPDPPSPPTPSAPTNVNQ